MFCPKCGGEIKDGAKFCPVCGAAAGRKPAKGTGGKSAPKLTKAVADAVETLSGTAPARKDERRATLLRDRRILMAVVFGVVILLAAVFLFQPRLKEEDAQKLVKAYFEESQEYSGNANQYAACFQYTVNDLTRQLSGNLTSMLSSWGMDTSKMDVNTITTQIGSLLSDYFSDASNQMTLAEAILEKSTFEAGKVEKKGGAVTMEITVTSLDITEINRQLLQDSVSVNGFVRMAMKFVGGGWLESIVDVAGGDISFVMDSFLDKVETVDKTNTYTGTIEFKYNREKKAWEISDVGPGILDAYYGIYK